MTFDRRRLAATTTILWLMVMASAARLELMRLNAASVSADGDDGATTLLVAETRQAIGQNLYLASDVYFHRGARAQPAAPRREDALTWLHDQIQPRDHEHLGDREVGEILPWLQATIRMDPGNIEAWRVAAFWLASPAVGKHDEATRLLLEAAHRHPGDYRPLLDLARLQLRAGDVERASRSLDQALNRWCPNPPRSDPDAVLFEYAELNHYRGLCAEIQADYPTAIAAYDRILEHFPDRTPIARRRNALQQGRIPDLPPRAWIQELTEHDDHQHHDCGHNPDDHADLPQPH